MYKISKEFYFSAAHALLHLPTTHPCKRVHGHNYVVVVEFMTYTLNDDQFVIDYRKLDPIKKWIDNTLDHRLLNKTFPFDPTSENMAKALFILIKNTFKEVIVSYVSIKETEKTAAIYLPEGDTNPDNVQGFNFKQLTFENYEYNTDTA